MNLLNKLQAVINSAARLVCYLKTAEHITPLLRYIHWLRIQERITFKLCVMAFKCQHNQAPAYLSDQLQQVSQVESRRRLRSSSRPTSSLVVPVTRRSTLGDRAFPVSTARAWNSLPSTVTAVPTLSSFRRALKSDLFTVSFPSWHTICRGSRLGSSITVLSDLAVFLTLRHLDL